MTALEHGRDMRFAHIRFESIHKCQFECIEAADWLQAERYSTTCIYQGRVTPLAGLSPSTALCHHHRLYATAIVLLSHKPLRSHVRCSG